MKQTEAVDIIYSLLPRMQQEAPETVIEKYAAANKLAAAQVERLGHVFNTATTLATLEKDRNAAPALMDVPKLVESYVKSTGRSKRASFLATTSEAPENSDPEKQTPEDVPNLWNQQDKSLPVIPKEAADNSRGWRQTLELACEVAERAVEEVVADLSKYANSVQKLAMDLLKEEQPVLKLATLVADTRDLASEYEADSIATKLANAFRSHGVAVESGDLQKAPPVVLSRDRTGYWPQVREACSYLKLASHTHGQLLEALDKAKAAAAYLPDDDWQVDNLMTKTASRVELIAEVHGLIKEASAEESPKKSEGEPENIIRLVEEGERDDYGQAYGLRHLLRPVGESAVKGTTEMAGQVEDVYSNKIPAYLGSLQPGGAVEKMLGLGPVAEQNARRVQAQGLSRRQAELDTISAANVKKLMITDEILSTKDPERVIEAFNSIRSAAPEVASDISLLRLLLRQAMETQGVDIDTATAARKFTQPNREEAARSR